MLPSDPRITPTRPEAGHRGRPIPTDAAGPPGPPRRPNPPACRYVRLRAALPRHHHCPLSIVVVAARRRRAVPVGLLARPPGATTPGTPVNEEAAFSPFWDAYRRGHRATTPAARSIARRSSKARSAGMIDALDDPYSSYLSPDEYRQSLQGISGQFEGIGAEVGPAARPARERLHHARRRLPARSSWADPRRPGREGGHPGRGRRHPDRRRHGRRADHGRGRGRRSGGQGHDGRPDDPPRRQAPRDLPIVRDVSSGRRSSPRRSPTARSATSG